MQHHHSLRQQMHPRHQRLYHSCQYNQELRRRHMGSSSASNPPQAAHHAPPDYANMYPHAPAVPAPMPAHLGRLPPGGLANPHSYIQNPGTVFLAILSLFAFLSLLVLMTILVILAILTILAIFDHMGSGLASNPPQAAHHTPPVYFGHFDHLCRLGHFMPPPPQTMPIRIPMHQLCLLQCLHI